MYTQNRLTENKLVVTSGEKEGGGTNQRYGAKRYKLQCIKQISSKDILFGTGNYSHYLVIHFNGVESIKILSHYVVHLKLYFSFEKRFVAIGLHDLGSCQENPKSIGKRSLGFGDTPKLLSTSRLSSSRKPQPYSFIF